MLYGAQSRRAFLASASAAAAGLVAAGQRGAGAEKQGTLEPPGLTVISGPARRRGKQYGTQFRDQIAQFLDREIYTRFLNKPSGKDALLRYAGACSGEIRRYSPTIHDELEGMAEGANIRFEEVVLINLHEELGHARELPKIDHCTAVAVGPPDTSDGHTYVGQTWDWMPSVAGLSSMLLWKRTEGPSLLAYAYPGLWVGAGMNSAGIALCWTSAAFREEKAGSRVAIPSYVLLAHLLYQESLADIAREARRATAAGWFTFVLGDASGNLLNVEGSPEEIAVEEHRGHLARVLYGSRQMTNTPAGQVPKRYERCEKMYRLLEGEKSNRAVLARHFSDPAKGICVGSSTLDMMIFDTTAREAHVSRGPSYGQDWKTFKFAEAAGT